MGLRLTPYKYNLNGGEVSPFFLGRTDHEKYGISEEKLSNFYPLLQGGITTRYGTRYICDAMGPSRLIPFIFSITQSYQLEFGNKTLRFYTNDSQITSGGSPVQITTPFDISVDNLWDIKFVQVGNTMYLVHPNHPPMKLQRITDTNWQLFVVNLFAPPINAFDQDISKGTITVSVSGLIGIVTLTAGAPVFIAGDVGKVVRIGSASGYIQGQDTWGPTTGNDPDTGAVLYSQISIRIINPFTTTGPFSSWKISISPGPSTYLGIGRLISGNWHNERRIGVSVEKKAFAFVDFPQDGQTPPALVDAFRTIDAGNYIVVDGNVLLIESVIDSSHVSTQSLATYSNLLTNLTSDGNSAGQSPYPAAGGSWSIQSPSFSSVHGYPRAVCFHQDRIWYGGTIDQPQTVWASVTGDYDNFAKGDKDDQGLDFTLTSGTFEQIIWLQPYLGNVIAGTFRGEFVITGGAGLSINVSQPITPTNVNVLLQSLYGVTGIQPLIVQGDLIYVQRAQRNAYQFAFNIYKSIFGSKNLNIINDVITSSGFKEMVYQQVPNYIIWFTDNSGNLVGLTYEENEQVFGWHRFFTGVDSGDQVISASSNPSPSLLSDERWMVCKRTRNGTPVYTVELEDISLQTDCASTLTSGSPVSSISSGLNYLKGRNAALLVDGQFIGIFAITGDSLAFPPAISGKNIQIGLGFTCEALGVRIETQAGLQSAQGLIKRFTKIWLRVYNSVNALINNKDRVLQVPAGSPPNTAILPFTGDVQVANSAGSDRDGRIDIKQDQPFSLTVLAVFGEINIGDN